MKPLTTPSTRPPVSPWVVLGVASLAAFMVFLDTQVLFVAFGDIRASFPSVSFATMSWTLSAYTIALAVAVWGAIAALAAAVGPTVGALLVQTWDWRAVFLANVPVGAVALVLALRI